MTGEQPQVPALPSYPAAPAEAPKPAVKPKLVEVKFMARAKRNSPKRVKVQQIQQPKVKYW